MTAPDVARLLAWIEAGEKDAPETHLTDCVLDYIDGNATSCVCGVPAHELAVYTALRAVVDLHREIPAALAGDYGPECVACLSEPWPCPTLLALVALAGDGDSGR